MRRTSPCASSSSATAGPTAAAPDLETGSSALSTPGCSLASLPLGTVSERPLAQLSTLSPTPESVPGVPAEVSDVVATTTIGRPQPVPMPPEVHHDAEPPTGQPPPIEAFYNQPFSLPQLEKVRGNSSSSSSSSICSTSNAGRWTPPRPIQFRVVFRPRIALRGAPSSRSVILGSVDYGEVIEVSAIEGGWVQLTAEEGLRRGLPLELSAAWVRLDGRGLGLGVGPLIERVDGAGFCSSFKGNSFCSGAHPGTCRRKHGALPLEELPYGISGGAISSTAASPIHDVERGVVPSQAAHGRFDCLFAGAVNQGSDDGTNCCIPSKDSTEQWVEPAWRHLKMMDRGVASPVDTFVCPICADTCSRRERVVLSSCTNAAHGLCLVCARAYFQARVGEMRVEELHCPIGIAGDGCRGPGSQVAMAIPKEVEAVLATADDGGASMERYRRFRRLRADARLRECPKCGHLCPPEVGPNDVVNPRMRCSGCGAGFCYYHSNAHEEEGVTCAEYEARLIRESRELAKQIGAKECPGCRRLTEKNGGCNHMTCQQCRCHWCWICGDRIDGDVGWHYSPANEVSGCMLFSLLGGHPPLDLVRMVRNVGGTRARGRWRFVQLAILFMRRLVKWWFTVIFVLTAIPIAGALFTVQAAYACVLSCIVCLPTCGVGVYCLLFRKASTRDFFSMHFTNLAAFNLGVTICVSFLVAWVSLVPIVLLWSMAAGIIWLCFFLLTCERPNGLVILLLQVPCDGVNEFMDLVGDPE
mmetsp:Transcript_126248/g.252183  ORF Transcript_126248/g.252183 Transcript_126248/m.252183 type:complete len:755 (-) Transcript_126248:158-2422(-)